MFNSAEWCFRLAIRFAGRSFSAFLVRHLVKVAKMVRISLLMRRVFAATLTAVVMSGTAFAEARSPGDEQSAGLADPFVDQLVAQTTEYLRSAERVRLSAEVTKDRLLPSGHMAQFSRSMDIWLRRPDRLRVHMVSDLGTMRFFYDGALFSMQQLERNLYASVEANGEIGEVAERLRANLDVRLPLIDLLVADAYENFRNNVEQARYLGQHYVNGKRMHHLLMSTASIDYQIWIEDSPTPLPRKVVVTYADRDGAPQFIARDLEWDFNARMPDLAFTFAPPADADEIEFAPAPAEEK